MMPWFRALARVGDTSPTRRRVVTQADTAEVPLGDVLWDEIERLRNIVRAAQATIEEMHPRSREIVGLSDDLIDLWNILKEAEDSNVRATSDN